MSQSDLLDVLIGLIIALVALIGLWQGIVRALLYLCGSFLGSELALWWSDNLGDLLADWLPLSTETARFLASTFFIISAMVLIGSGFSSLTLRYPQDWRNRAGGFLAGLGLGMLTLGLILRYYFVFLQSEAESALGETRIASALWSDFNYVVLAVAAALGLMIIVGWILGPPEAEYSQLALAQRSVAVAPPPRSAARSSGGEPFADPIPPLSDVQRGGIPTKDRESDSLYQPFEELRYSGVSANGPTGPGDGDLEPSVRSPAPDPLAASVRDLPDYGVQKATALESFSAEKMIDRRESSGMCPNCGMLLRQGDAYCPDCGFPADS